MPSSLQVQMEKETKLSSETKRSNVTEHHVFHVSADTTDRLQYCQWIAGTAWNAINLLALSEVLPALQTAF